MIRYAVIKDNSFFLLFCGPLFEHTWISHSLERGPFLALQEVYEYVNNVDKYII